MRSLARSHGPRGVGDRYRGPGACGNGDDQEHPPGTPETSYGRDHHRSLFCAPEEVAEVVCWLATDAPAFMNGEVIDVNNGMNCR